MKKTYTKYLQSTRYLHYTNNIYILEKNTQLNRPCFNILDNIILPMYIPSKSLTDSLDSSSIILDVDFSILSTSALPM